MSTATTWKPANFHTVTPQLSVNDAVKMIDWYVKAFNGEKVSCMLDPTGKRVMHAEVKIGESIIFINDPFTEAGGHVSSSSFFLYVPDVDAAYKRAIGAGAVSKMEPKDQFWGDRMGSVTCPAGQNWSLATHIKDLTDKELNVARDAFYASMAAKKPGA